MLPIQDASLLRQQCFIDGQWLGADDGTTLPVTNPADGSVLGSVPRMGGAETGRAIAAAAAAQPAWRRRTAQERAQVLRRWFELILASQEDLAVLMTAEQGKPLAESRGEIQYAASFIEWFAEEARRVYGDTVPGFAEDKRILVLKEELNTVPRFFYFYAT